ncbi:hypothetical protein [Mucilaginibacter sp.]
MELIEVRTERRKVKGLLNPFRGLGVFLLLCATATSSNAQTFDEWFRQGKTQIKYLTQQIAALSAFESSVRQGYNMAKNEWGAIGNFKDGELNLHQGYYNSLSQVKPVVKNSTNLTAIQSEQQGINSQFNTLNGLAGLSAQEQTYIQSVAQNVIAECGKALDELQTVLTPGGLVMSDDERIKRISKISASIKDAYVFTCSFCTQVRLLAAQRNGDSNDASEMGNLYGINP